MTTTNLPALPDLYRERDLYERWTAQLRTLLADRENRYGTGCRPDLRSRLVRYTAHLARLGDVIRQEEYAERKCSTEGCRGHAAFILGDRRECHACLVARHTAEVGR
jgi:hypothetical protein